MKSRNIGVAVFALWALSANATTVNVGLGTAEVFAILGGNSVYNTGVSQVAGNVGAGPGGTIGGFPPGTVTGGAILDPNDPFSMAASLQAQVDLSTAYKSAANAACGTVMTGDLGGLTLTPGSYCFASSAMLTGKLTLNALGDPNAVFLFQIGSSLTTAGGASVVFVNGGQGGNLIWQVGSSATIGSSTTFAGNILALSNITLDQGATINCGRVLSQNGDVSMDTNIVSDLDSATCLGSSPDSNAPEPGSAGLLGLGLLSFGLILYRREARKHTAQVLCPDKSQAYALAKWKSTIRTPRL